MDAKTIGNASNALGGHALKGFSDAILTNSDFTNEDAIDLIAYLRNCATNADVDNLSTPE